MTHTLPIRIYYEDTDAGGVVYHANYLKFAERARTEWLRELGLEQRILHDEYGILFVVRHLEIDYQKAGKLDDELIVETHLQELGNASITMQQTILRADDHLTLAVIKVVVVCVNASFKPTRLPQKVRQRLQ